MSRYLATIDDLRKYGPDLAGADVAIDVETTGLKWWSDQLIGLGVACPERGIEMYVPANSDGDRAVLGNWVKKLPADRLIGHNLKFDLHFLGIAPGELAAASYEDTTLLGHLLDSRQRKALGELELKYLGSTSKRNHVEKAGPRGSMVWEWPLPAIADYCVNDCVVTWQLFRVLYPQAEAMELVDLYRKDLLFMDSIWRSERLGVKIDTVGLIHALETLVQWHTLAMGALADLFATRGIYNINYRSLPQLSKALYDDWPWERPKNPYVDSHGVDRSRSPVGGHYNANLTSSFILLSKAHHPAGDLLAWIRELDRMIGVLGEWVQSLDRDCRIHSSFNQASVRTGRLSSSEPALQNIPSQIRSKLLTYEMVGGGGLIREDELNLRKLLIPTPGYTFASIDHKQQEIRMFAVMAQEPRMLEAAMTGQDIHKQVAQMVWGDSGPVHREWAKVISFGLIYGMNVSGMEHRLNKTRAEAEKIGKQYWTTFPRVLPWLREVREYCTRYGFVRYWSDRLWKEDDPTFTYKAANAIIQGGSADLMTIACMRCDRLLQKLGAGRPLLYVHDEVLFELPIGDAEEIAKRLAKEMEVEDLLGVPFFADAKLGPNYGEVG